MTHKDTQRRDQPSDPTAGNQRPLREVVCPWCGETFMQRLRSQKFCQPEHGRQWHRWATREGRQHVMVGRVDKQSA